MNWQIANAQKELANRRKAAGINARLSTDTPTKNKPIQQLPQDAPRSPQKPQNERKPAERVKVYPAIANAFLQQDPRNDRRTLASVGRVYFLLRAYDQQGSGKLETSDAIRCLVSCTSSTRRNIRGILKQGNGLTWKLANDHIYLASAANIAIALDAGKLTGKPVYIPVCDFTAGIQKVKAAFLAAYHAGRDANPITRQAIRQLTGIPERTQQVYDKLTETAVIRNIASRGEAATKENRQRRSWQHGKGAFVFIDYRGVNFRKGAAVMAWRLPNSYNAPYEQAPKGRQRKHNKRIDLVIKRQLGNGFDGVRTYHPNVRIAARYLEADPGHDQYYPAGRQLVFTASKPAKLEGADFWRALC